jgi:O-Antigen ligase.
MKRKRDKTAVYIDKLALILTIIFLSIIPLLIQVNKVPNMFSEYRWYSSQTVSFDSYSLIKSNAIMILGVLALTLVIIKQVKQRTYSIKDPVIILSLLFAFFILISHVFSASTELSNSGTLERYENTWVWLSYLSVFTLVYGITWKPKTLKLLMTTFIASNVILSLIGIIQYLGFDPVFNDFTKHFITGSSMKGINYSADYSINYKVIVQTLYHYNYVGFYIALSLPIVMSLALFTKEIKMRVAYIILSGAMFFNLLGSSARGGLVGIVVALPFFLILNRHMLFKNLKVFMALILITIMVFTGFEFVTNGFISSRIANIFTSVEAPNKLTGLTIDQDLIKVQLKDNEFAIKVVSNATTGWSVEYYLNQEPVIPAESDADNKIQFAEPELVGIKNYIEKNDSTLLLVVETYGTPWRFAYDSNYDLAYVNEFGKLDKIISPKTLGFQGKEKLGSSRGYIWSRTLPLILESPIVGYGSDTFPIVFPQQDYVGKYNAYGTTNMIVDKAHNEYLQIAINSGIPALIIYLALIIIALAKSIRKSSTIKFVFDNVYQSAFTLAVISYSAAAIFNDSSVHVSPVFWTILALSFVAVKPSFTNQDI